MKVAVIIDTWFPAVGGGQVNVWEISKRIPSKNFQIDIITRNNGKDNLPKRRYINVHKLGPKSKPDDALAKIIFIIRAFFFLFPRKYDLLHVHPFLPAIPAKIISLIKRIPIVITIHGTRLFEKDKLFTPSLILEWLILTRIKYDLVISVTHAFTKIRNSNKKIKVIPNGVNLANFNKVKIKKTNFPKILWVGRFDKVKRVDNLLFAMKHVVKHLPKAKLELVGYGYEEKSLRRLTNKLNLEKSIQFVGEKTNTDLIREYKSSHLFVLSSSSEGAPLSLLEAQGCSLPIVATKTGDIPKIVKHNLNGLLVRPDNQLELANAIIWCLKNKNDFGKNGHLFVKKIRSWDALAKKTMMAYKSLLS